MRNKEDLISFLKDKDLATLATVSSEHTPHASSIYFFVDENLSFYFVTKSQTRKHDNIKSNNLAALVITDAVNLQTVQVEGTVSEITDTKELDMAINSIVKVALGEGRSVTELPIVKIQKGQLRFFKVNTRWIRWSSLGTGAETVKYEEGVD